MTLGDRVAVMRAACCSRSTRRKELYDNPLNLFVAGFIGSPAMNFFAGQVEGDHLKLADRRRAAPGTSCAGGRRAPRGAGDLIAGMRPEHFEDAGARRRTSRAGRRSRRRSSSSSRWARSSTRTSTRARAARRARSSPSWPPTAAPPTSRLRARGSRSRAWSRRRRRPRDRATRWASIPRRSTCSTCGRGATSSSPRAAGTAARRQRSSHPPRSRPLRSRTRRRMRLPRPRRRRRRRSRPRRRLSPRTSLGRRHHPPVVALGADAQVGVGLGPIADLIGVAQCLHERCVLAVEPLARGLAGDRAARRAPARRGTPMPPPPPQGRRSPAGRSA